MSCACGGGCGGGGPQGFGTPLWQQTGPGETTTPDGGPRGRGMVGQPDRATRMPGERSSRCPWWFWLLVGLVAYHVLKGAR
jgi:hypothetical protein